MGGDDVDTTGRDVVGGREGGLQGQDTTTFDVLLGGVVAKTSSRKGSINPDVIANFNSPLQVCSRLEHLQNKLSPKNSDKKTRKNSDHRRAYVMTLAQKTQITGGSI